MKVDRHLAQIDGQIDGRPMELLVGEKFKPTCCPSSTVCSGRITT